jgi:hypothetical protein
MEKNRDEKSHDTVPLRIPTLDRYFYSDNLKNRELPAGYHGRSTNKRENWFCLYFRFSDLGRRLANFFTDPLGLNSAGRPAKK